MALSFIVFFKHVFSSINIPSLGIEKSSDVCCRLSITSDSAEARRLAPNEFGSKHYTVFHLRCFGCRPK